MTTQANIGQAFPLEKLGSDIARNNYNYESILNGIIEWNRTPNESVVIRLTKDADPFFQDYIIPSRRAVCEDNTLVGKLFHEAVSQGQFGNTSQINSVFYGGRFINLPPWTPDPDDLGDLITFRITVLNNGGTTWKIFYLPLVQDWVSGSDYRYGQYGSNRNLVTFGGNNYRIIDNVINSVISPDIDIAHFEPATFSDTQPQEITEIPAFGVSRVCRFRLSVDTAGFILQNSGSVASTDLTDITVRISPKHQELPSIYQKTVDVFKSGNLSNWPESNAPAWLTGSIIPETISNPDVRFRQSYSGIMVFNHADQARCKTVNFINYDGPDLDQGLCIYLPVVVETECGAAEPEDGFTYEFYFRLWPNPAFTQAVTRDHIVNKAQIYVYSTNHIDNVLSDESATEPIAKFSMARMTNFYMFGENVSIPDKPVIYRATFIYSRTQNKWITLDYYQLPDHIFMGPIGFVDPQNPGASDINSETLGNINPNAKFIGYETGAFPTFSDVFSNPDLSPFRLNGGSIEDFFNRIVD